MPKVILVETEENVPMVRPISIMSNSAPDRVQVNYNNVPHMNTIYKHMDADGMVTYYRYDHHTSDWYIIKCDASKTLAKMKEMAKESEGTPWTKHTVFEEWWPGGRPGSSGNSNIR